MVQWLPHCLMPICFTRCHNRTVPTKLLGWERMEWCSFGKPEPHTQERQRELLVLVCSHLPLSQTSLGDLLPLITDNTAGLLPWMHPLQPFSWPEEGISSQRGQSKKPYLFTTPSCHFSDPRTNVHYLPAGFCLCNLLSHSGARQGETVCVCGWGLINPSTVCSYTRSSCVAAHMTFVIREMTKTWSQYSQMSSALPWLLQGLSMHLQEHSKGRRM